MGADGMVGIAVAEAVSRRQSRRPRCKAAAGGGDSAAHRHLQGGGLGPRRRRHRPARHARGAGARARAVVEQAGRTAVAQARHHAGLNAPGGAMLDFTDEQKMARQMLRAVGGQGAGAERRARWRKAKSCPTTSCASSSPRSAWTRWCARSSRSSRTRRASDARSASAAAIGDPGLMAIVSMELSRVCPGFCLAFGASLGPRRRRHHGQGHARRRSRNGRCRS